MYHSTDLLTIRGVVHGTSGSTSYETIPHVQSEISGDVLSTADMVVQRRDGPRRLREIDDDDESCHTATGTHMPHEITQCYLPPDRGDIPFLPQPKLVFDLATKAELT